MKLIRLLFLMLVTLPAYSQWQGSNPVWFTGGNVGIGTSTPDARLKVYNSATFNTNMSPAGQDHLLLHGTAPGNGGFFGGIAWQIGDRRRAAIAASQEHTDEDYIGLAFFTKGTDGPGPIYESMRLTRGGNLGVGTTSPSAKVQINGDGAGSTALSIIENPVSGAGAHFLSEGANNVMFQLRRTADNLPNTEFRTGGNSFINAISGNVGIGTTTPDAKLTVKGDIHTREVKVDLAGAVGPDYVFEKDYPLTSLEELKSYIDKNKHLPEIPSAKEMEEEGINLKEMNLLLLKKVEELTLHLIERQRIERVHEERIEMLTSEIQKLKEK